MTANSDHSEYKDWTKMDWCSHPDHSQVVEKSLSQPSPTPNNQPETWGLVIDDMVKRNEFGKNKYKTALQAFNGRNAAVDAYEEVLDLSVYMKNMIIERQQMVIKLKTATMLIGNILIGVYEGSDKNKVLEPLYRDLWDFLDSLGEWTKD